MLCDVFLQLRWGEMDEANINFPTQGLKKDQSERGAKGLGQLDNKLHYDGSYQTMFILESPLDRDHVIKVLPD